MSAKAGGWGAKLMCVGRGALDGSMDGHEQTKTKQHPQRVSRSKKSFILRHNMT